MEGYEAIGELTRNGFMVKMTSIENLTEWKKEILQLKEEAPFDEQFYQKYSHWLNFELTEDLTSAKSILILAYPQFTSKLNFTLNDKDYSLTISPAYLYSKILNKINEIFEENIVSNNYNYIRAKLPEKLLAFKPVLVNMAGIISAILMVWAVFTACFLFMQKIT